MRISKKLRTAAMIAAAVLVVALVAYFFKNQFTANWDKVRNAHFEPRYPLLATSLACILVTYLVSTAMWRHGVNLLASGRKFSIAASIGMVNATQLTKYIPGRVWGYAMQMALIDRSSVPASGVLYVNIVYTMSKSFISLILGGLYLSFSSRLLSRPVAYLATAAAVAVYVFFLLFNARFFNLLLRISERVFRRKIVLYDLGHTGVLKMQLLGLVAVLTFGVSGVLACQGIGFATSPAIAWSVFAGFPLADTAGFLVLIVPGGLGVREGLFYLLLREYGAGSLALILPIVMRVISMIADAILGAVGLVCLRTLVKDNAA